MNGKSTSRYDAEAQHSMQKWFYNAILFGISTFVFGFAFVMFMSRVYAPFSDFHHKRVHAREIAAEYVKSDVCTDVHKRAVLGDFSKCEESHKILEQSAFRGAFFDLMHYLSICDNNLCRFFSLDVSTILPQLFMLAIVGLFVLFLLSFCGFSYATYVRANAQYQLPMGGEMYGQKKVN